MEFTITAQNGDSVKIEAENWMVALGKAMTFFRLDVADLGRIVCNPAADGSIFIDNPAASRSWMVRRVEPKITVVAAAASTQLDEPEYVEPPSAQEEEAPLAPPPALTMPVTSSLKKEVEEVAEPEESLAERLFDLSMELATASPDEACQMALDLLQEFVSFEAASVARGTINDPELRFVAATGPVKDEIVGRTLQFGEGLIGMCFDMGGTLLIDDVGEEDLHVRQFDEDTGFTTRAALCVPITDEEGSSFGVLQLLNPGESGFTPANVEVVETIARTLAGALSHH